MSDDLDPLGLEGTLHVEEGRVVEEDGWRSARDGAVVEDDSVVWQFLQEYFLDGHIFGDLRLVDIEEEVLKLLVF